MIRKKPYDIEKNTQKGNTDAPCFARLYKENLVGVFMLFLKFL
jgi:hypothetical protein